MQSMHQRKKIIKNASCRTKKIFNKSFLTGSIKTIFVILSTILFLPLIIKNIGMSNYGIIALATIFSGNIAFLDLGIQNLSL